MTSPALRRAGRLFAALLLLLVPATTAQAKAKPKPKPKKVHLTAKVTKVDVRRGVVSVQTGSGRRKKSLSVRVQARAQLRGLDHSGDGLLGLDDVRRGDRLTVDGRQTRSTVDASLVTNRTGVDAGDKNFDGLPDSVATRAVTGTLVSVNAEQRLAVVQVATAPGQSDLVGQQLSVSLAEGAVLVVGDRDGNRRRNWSDVQTGDQLQLVLLAPVDVANAQAILAVDLTSLGQKPRRAVDREMRGLLPLSGAVAAVDAAAGTVTIQTVVLGVTLPAVTLPVGEDTELEVDDTNQDGEHTLDDVQVGDKIKALVRPSSDLSSITATVKLLDRQPKEPGAGEALRLGGQVAAIDLEARTLDVTVNDGPLAGQTVQVKLSLRTRLEIRARGGWTAVQVGDSVRVLVNNASDLQALVVRDEGPVEIDDPEDGGDNSDPPSGDPLRLQATVQSVDRAARTLQVLVTSDGELSGQTVTLHWGAESALGVPDQNGDGRRNWLDVQPDDQIWTLVDGADSLNIIILGDFGAGGPPDNGGDDPVDGGGDDPGDDPGDGEDS